MTILDRLYIAADKNTIMGYAIHNAISEKIPARQIIATVKAQGMDNEIQIVNCIGKAMWEEIKQTA